MRLASRLVYARIMAVNRIHARCARLQRNYKMVECTEEEARIMRKTSMKVIAVCATLLWVGAGQAARLETNSTNPAVPEGTVYDTLTQLLWEMKTPAGTGDVHDVNNRYTWSVGRLGSRPDGTVFKTFLASLNGGDYNDPSRRLVVNSNPTSCFANRCDWRLPEIGELLGIVDLSAPGCNSHNGPCIDPIFGPTKSDFSWSGTTNARDVNQAWTVFFSDGDRVVWDKDSGTMPFVRAVRSGL
jgi:hypothetical protein